MNRFHRKVNRGSRRLSVNCLEDRCTPAVASVTYADVDGDLVKITAGRRPRRERRQRQLW
jgi:hypothetical protein